MTVTVAPTCWEEPQDTIEDDDPAGVSWHGVALDTIRWHPRPVGPSFQSKPARTVSRFRSTIVRSVLAILMVAITSGAEAMILRPLEPLRPNGLLKVQGDVGPAGAAAAARAATGGRVLGVTASKAGGRTVYRVKVLLPGGRMRTVTVDGPTGQVQG